MWCLWLAQEREGLRCSSYASAGASPQQHIFSETQNTFILMETLMAPHPKSNSGEIDTWLQVELLQCAAVTYHFPDPSADRILLYYYSKMHWRQIKRSVSLAEKARSCRLSWSEQEELYISRSGSNSSRKPGNIQQHLIILEVLQFCEVFVQQLYKTDLLLQTWSRSPFVTRAWRAAVKELWRLSPRRYSSSQSETKSFRLAYKPITFCSPLSWCCTVVGRAKNVCYRPRRSRGLMFLLSFCLQTSHLLAYVIRHWVLGCSLGSHTALHVSESDIQSL